ncbi:MAG TPA: histidine--tRNA ligase [Acidimicrobiales bacterium]|nr:histidine--tRNA ligase [Acidimicrobiales bacterium]
MPELRHPPGTFDVLAPDSARWAALLATFASVVERAGYGLVVTPTFEDLAVFQRVGESTDIVRKEMYDFVDKGDRHVALRPELTAGVVRAFVQHRPPVPWKAWYAGSQFRFERPQAGRYREFHQVGVEAFGVTDADLDVEVVALGWEFYRALGLARVELLVNSLGDATCRPPYREMLVGYLRAHRAELCDEHRERIDDNPLRVLDCKRPACRAVVAGAPLQVDHLCEPCAAHFARVTGGLDALAIPWTLQPTLVRGLDYYTRTTFEYAGLALESAQNALGGGGRYDGLVEQMGGPPTPGVGFALGVERTLMACDAEGTLAAPAAAVDVFVVDFAGGAAARDLTAELRAGGLRADRAFDGRSAKAQFKAADRSGARLALVVGPGEAEEGTVVVQHLAGERGDRPPPATVGRADALAAVRAALG